MMGKKGFYTMFDAFQNWKETWIIDGALHVTRGCFVVMKGVQENDLYVLKSSTIIGLASTSTVDQSQITKFWHHRLDHVNERGLQELEKQGLFGEKKFSQLEFCEHCFYGKATRLKFNKAVHTTRGILNHVHFDL